jgi:NADH:ubiquinone oxidoreductase subunit 5 (subunit L)/multisubunit Na+/H+ antiporter MnhA subunit
MLEIFPFLFLPSWTSLIIITRWMGFGRYFFYYGIFAELLLFVLVFMCIMLISYIFSNRYGSRKIFLRLWIINWVFCFVITSLVFYVVAIGHFNLYVDDWLTLNIPHFLPITFGFIIDDLSIKMFSLVLFISFCVQLFSFAYMKDESQQIYFMIILHIFTFFMLLFVLSSNLLLSFLAWEGLGFVSFALINFWNARDEANKASFKAIIFNRIADVWFVLSIIFCLVYFDSLDFCTINALSSSSWLSSQFIFIPFYGPIRFINVLSFTLFLAAIGKSAQLGYHVWLTAAMEGPSPVSALLHSATMVTAGVYLLLRCNEVFCYSSPLVITLIISVGILTCFFCGWFAFLSSDFKRVVAYSTCSHLGLMFCLIGFGFFEVAELHLHVHAFFKTTLFLSAGLVMSLMLHLQNFRKIASFALFLPICYSLLLFSGISLLGMPFTLGSISKERFIMLGYTNAEYSFVLTLFFTTSVIALLTALLYTIRLVINFGHQPGYNGERRFPFFLKSETSGLWFSQFLLCTLVILFYMFLSMYFMKGLVALDPWHWINLFSLYYSIHINTLPFSVKFFLIVMLFIFYIVFTNVPYYHYFSVFSVLIYSKTTNISLNLRLSLKGFNPMLNRAYTIFSNFEYYLGNIFYKIIHMFLSISFKLFIVWERGFLEIYGPFGLTLLFVRIKSFFMTELYSKNLFDYLWDIFCGLLFIILTITLLVGNFEIYRILFLLLFIYLCIICDK